MSYIISRRLRTYKPKEKVFTCPNIDEILPSLNDFEYESEKQEFAIKVFNQFYIKYIESSSKKFFIRLPLKFFTKENAERIKEYAKIVFSKRIEDCELGLDVLNLPTSKEFYEDLYKTLLRRLNQRQRELKKAIKEKEMSKLEQQNNLKKI